MRKQKHNHKEKTRSRTASGLTAPSSAGPGKRLQQYENTRSHPIGENASSTARWNDVPCGTMDEVRSHVRLDLPSLWRQGRPKDCSPHSRIPYWKGPGAESEEKHEPASDIDTKVVDSLKSA